MQQKPSTCLGRQPRFPPPWPAGCILYQRELKGHLGAERKPLSWEDYNQDGKAGAELKVNTNTTKCKGFTGTSGKEPAQWNLLMVGHWVGTKTLPCSREMGRPDTHATQALSQTREFSYLAMSA